MTGCNLCSSNIVYGVMREVIIDGQKVYVCEDCGKVKHRKTEYDQNGFVTKDYIEEDE